MQKFIAKYGLAAHLAVVAVAPLFLSSFLSAEAVATVLIWLSLLCGLWTLLSPSALKGETLQMARHRVVHAVAADPLFWSTIVLALLAGVQALNGGIRLAYDAENATWRLTDAILPVLPGAVEAAGPLPFATAVALIVLLQGTRHSLGRVARAAFLFAATLLSGLAALAAFLAAVWECPGLTEMFAQSNAACSFAGYSHGLFLLCGTCAIVTVFKQRWRVVLMLLIAGLAANAAGVFAFAPVRVSAAFGVAELVLLLAVFVYAQVTLRSNAGFKLLVFWGFAITLGAVLAAGLMPETALMERLNAYQDLSFLPDGFWESRQALSAIGMKSFLSHLWIGSGLGSFPLVFRFNASPADWELLPLGASALHNGWWKILAEGGLVGLVAYVLPLCFLVFTYSRRLVGGVHTREWPDPTVFLAPLALALLVADGFLDCTLTRAEVILMTGAMLAVSAATFRKGTRQDNG